MKITLSETGQAALIKHKNQQLIWDLATGLVHPGGSDLFSSKEDLKKGIKSIKLMRKFTRYMEKTHNMKFVKGVPELRVADDGPTVRELQDIIKRENEPKGQPKCALTIGGKYRFDFKDQKGADWTDSITISNKKFKKAMANDPTMTIQALSMNMNCEDKDPDKNNEYYNVTFMDHKGRIQHMEGLGGYHLEPLTP